jgi:hypothetical protein
MSLILSSYTTSVAINTINDRLTGGTYDNNDLFWNSYFPYIDSFTTTFINGGNVVKRDINIPNLTATTGLNFDGQFSTRNLIAGGGNVLKLGYSFNNTIFAGTGNTIDFVLNSVFSGTDNKFENSGDYFHTDGVGYAENNLDNSSILSGSGNTMEGIFFMPKNSVIASGINNRIFDDNGSSTTSEDIGSNTIINGQNNLIQGALGYSWIGNGSGNTITNSGSISVGNFILNGSGNTIQKTSNGTFDYNSILGGSNNNITNKNNSIIIGSNLNAANSDTTHVNKLFVDKKIFFSDYNYYEINNNAPSIIFPPEYRSLIHNGKTVNIVERKDSFVGDIKLDIENGYYVGQQLYIIAIPTGNTTGDRLTRNIGYYSTNDSIFVGFSGNVISNQTNPFINPMGSGSTLYDFTTFSGLGIFIWDGNYWIRADHRGAI